MNELFALKIVFLFVAILFTITNIIRLGYKNDIPTMNLIWQALGITGFVTLQWLI
jgi:hypothetical protein